MNSRTKRDHVLIYERFDGTEAWVERRSDYVGTLETVAGRNRRAGTIARMYLGNMATGEVKALP